MSQLRIYADSDASAPLVTTTDHAAIARELDAAGILFERWQADRELAATASQEEVIAAYRDSVDRLMTTYGFQSVDVISLHPDHPAKTELRQKFLNEHTHSEYEVRFFVEGQGLFCIHKGGKVYCVLCEQGDLISVPDNTPHWFDMGPNPRFRCIRLFTNPEGWVANFTGSDIAERFPRLEN
ncbi:MAG TPA: acireductone dioxygenase [Candidatus Competibacteraceae bacterium]|nr:acireductone dioxygenase [Candidatus Competibacteraceae bacterium]